MDIFYRVSHLLPNIVMCKNGGVFVGYLLSLQLGIGSSYAKEVGGKALGPITSSISMFGGSFQNVANSLDVMVYIP